MYKIRYDTESAFYNGISELLKRGLHFNADHNLLTIVLSGAY